MKNFDFSKYCTPAQLYLVIGVISIISSFFANYSIEMLLTNGLFLVIWTWVLNWLCSKGFKAVSWILVLLPFIFFLFTYFLIKDVAVKEGFLGDKAARDKAAKNKDAKRKTALDNAREVEAAKRDAAAKAAAERAAAKAATCQACGSRTGLKNQNSCRRENQC